MVYDAAAVEAGETHGRDGVARSGRVQSDFIEEAAMASVIHG
jgi:hypothetical protein